MQGTPINWNTTAGNTRLIQSPYYIRYSNLTFAEVSDKKGQIITDIKLAKAGYESAEVVGYLCWLLRIVALMA